MTYIDYLNQFHQWLESNDLPGNAQLLYYNLLHVFNRAGWPRNLRVDTIRLMMMAGCQKDAAYRARGKLVKAGFISYQKGGKGNPTLYFLSDKTTESATVSATESKRESATRNAPQEKRNKTKNNPPKVPQGTVDVFLEYAKGDSALLEALRGFEESRKGQKKPMTERSKSLLLSKLDKLSQDVVDKARYKRECLEEATLNGWQSVYELKAFVDREAVVQYGPAELLPDVNEVDFPENLTEEEFWAMLP